VGAASGFLAEVFGEEKSEMIPLWIARIHERDHIQILGQLFKKSNAFLIPVRLNFDESTKIFVLLQKPGGETARSPPRLRTIT
jgi:hypothetical protein